MKPSDISEAILESFRIGRACFIHGASGIGKTAVVNQTRTIGVDRGIWSPAARVWDFRMIYREPVDMLGAMHVVLEGNTHLTRYAQPADLPLNASDEGILFLDEFNSASTQNQGPGYQLFNEHRVGSHIISPKVHIVGAGNRVSDRGLVNRMPDPLIDRMFHFEMSADLQDWTQWALANNIRADVIGYYRFRPTHLHMHDPLRKEIPYATPRGAEDISKIRGLKSRLENELIRARVGDAVGGEMIAYFMLCDRMVSPDAILLNPTSAEIPKNCDIMYALAIALARRASLKNFPALYEYVKRIPKEYAQCLMSEATRLTPTLTNTREFIEFASANS